MADDHHWRERDRGYYGNSGYYGMSAHDRHELLARMYLRHGERKREINEKPHRARPPR